MNDIRGGGPMGLDGMDRLARDEFRGARPRIFRTESGKTQEFRTFVWTKMGWFERMEGPWGDVAFTPVADSEEQLRDWLSQDDADIDLIELDKEYDRNVYQEFMEQADQPLYPESPENSSQEPFEEQDVT